MDDEATAALDQIDINHYADAFGDTEVFKIGAAFYKKNCRVVGRN